MMVSNTCLRLLTRTVSTRYLFLRTQPRMEEFFLERRRQSEHSKVTCIENVIKVSGVSFRWQ